MASETTPSAIEHQLTLDILRGRYPVGSHLPTVRDLAARHGVNPGTIQRVVARLETRGLVEARQGSGLRVVDARENGDFSLVPYWLEATLDQPTRAAEILEEFLELRRLVAGRLLVKHREAILAHTPRLRTLAAALAEAEGLEARREADLAFARELLRATGNLVGLAVLNTLAKVLEQLPEVATAMYDEPEANAASMMRILAALVAGGDDAERTIGEATAEIDARTVKRFAAALRRRPKGAS